MRFTFRHQTVEVERVAFPIAFALAYCYSIHKAQQGQTLEEMCFDATSTDAFAHGQTYAGLTRATSSTTLTIVADPTDITFTGAGQVIVKNVAYPRFLGRKVVAPPATLAAAEKEYKEERRQALRKRRAGAGRKSQGAQASRNQAAQKNKFRKVMPAPK